MPREKKREVPCFYRESSIVGNSCTTYQCWRLQVWVLKIGISGYTLVPREPRPLAHPPVWCFLIVPVSLRTQPHEGQLRLLRPPHWGGLLWWLQRGLWAAVSAADGSLPGWPRRVQHPHVLWVSRAVLKANLLAGMWDFQKSRSQRTGRPRPALRVWGNCLQDWKRTVFKVRVGRTLRESLVLELTIREKPLNHCRLTLEFPNCVLWCYVNCFVTIGCCGPKAWGRLCKANHVSKKGRGGSAGMVKFCRWSPSIWCSHTPSDVDDLQCKEPSPVERLGPVICSKARPMRAGDTTPFYSW